MKTSLCGALLLLLQASFQFVKCDLVVEAAFDQRYSSLLESRLIPFTSPKEAEVDNGVEAEYEIFDKAPSDVQARSLIPILKGSGCTRNSEVYCYAKCSQFKLLAKSGCCRCNCRLGYALDDDRTSCRKTKWSAWSGWGACIESDWGGLQQRERFCVAKGRLRTGRCRGKGSEARLCSEIRKPFRIRKNIRHLTDEELHDLLQAFSKYKKDNSTHGHMHTIKFHGWPYLCPWYKIYPRHEDGHCSWHGHPLFLPWHRMITVQFELGLNRYLKDKTIGVPYWDWTEPDWYDIPDMVRHPFIMDPILKRRVKNPFYRTYLNKTSHNWRVVERSGIHNYKLLLRGVIRAMMMPNYMQMDIAAEKPHNQIHNCMCVSYNNVTEAECEISMMNTMFSTFDPLFFLHHSQVDRIFALYKAIHDYAGDQDWTRPSFVEAAVELFGIKPDVVGAFDWPLAPFCNESINSNPVTLNPGVWTPRNSFYHEQMFGYKYDTFNMGEHSWRGLVLDHNWKQQSHYNGLVTPFISSMAPSLGKISRSNTKYKNYGDGCTVPQNDFNFAKMQSPA